jgi:hypothetical protein
METHKFDFRGQTTMLQWERWPNERIQPTEKSAARSSLCFLRRLMRSVRPNKTIGENRNAKFT